MSNFKKVLTILIIVFIGFSFSSCSINKMATKAISKSFGESGMAAFTKDDDPQLVKDSLPFVLKLNEILIESDPGNYEVKAAAGKLFIIYSNLFIQTPATMLDYNDWKKQSEMLDRSKKLYIRGSNYLTESIEAKYKINIDFSDKKTVEYNYKKEDVDTLYWLGAGLMSAISIDLTDPFLAPLRDGAMRIMFIAYDLDPDYGNGVLHEYFIMYYASMPESLGGSLEKAEYHYKKALELSGGSKISPYIAYATTVCPKKQTKEGVAEYKKILEKAITFDMNKYPENKLENTINKEKAVWLLNNIDNYFLID